MENFGCTCYIIPKIPNFFKINFKFRKLPCHSHLRGKILSRKSACYQSLTPPPYHSAVVLLACIRLVLYAVAAGAVAPRAVCTLASLSALLRHSISAHPSARVTKILYKTGKRGCASR